MIINAAIVRWIHVAAITICPIIIIDPEIKGAARRDLLVHEWAHMWQQYWFGCIGAMVGVGAWVMLSWPPQPAWVVTLIIGTIEGWVAGQLLWRFLYLFCLPRWYNFFRRRWETVAFRAQGISDDEIKKILAKAPYHLRG